MVALAQDLRYAARRLRRNAGFAAAVVLTLALAIGANVAIFAVVHAVLLRPLPFPGAGDLVAVWETTPEKFRVTAGNYRDWRDAADSFSDLALVGNGGFVLTGEGEPELVPGARVSGNYFSVLGVRPLAGRLLVPSDDAPGAPPVAVLSEGLWRRRFGADPGLVGRRVRLDGQEREVVGIAPDSLYPIRVPTVAALPLGDVGSAVWLPLALPEERRADRRSHLFGVVGRLAAGATLEGAQAEMDTIAVRLAREHPRWNEGEGALVVPLHAEVAGHLRAPFLALLVGAALLAVTAWANAAGLAAVRATERGEEHAVRAALGAEPSQLWRLAVTEGVTLGLAAGSLGLAVAGAALRLVRSLGPAELPRLAEVAISAAPAAFGVALALVSSLILALTLRFPVSPGSVLTALRAGPGSDTPPERRRLQAGLVVAETALAVVLVANAGLLVKSLSRLLAVDPGFGSVGVLDVTIGLPPRTYPEAERVAAFYEALLGRMAVLPGVEAAAAAYDHPLSASWIDSFAIEGQLPEPDAEPQSGWLRIVTPDYFRTLGVPLHRGRVFSGSDRRGTPGVAIVNEAFGRTHFGGDDPLGERLRLTTPAAMWAGAAPEVFEIVGVVGDVRFLGLEAEPEPAFYLPFAQFPQHEMEVLVRGSGDPLTLAPAVREQVWELDRDLPVAATTTLAALLAAETAERRFQAGLLAAFGAATLSLAAIGLYGFLTYLVSPVPARSRCAWRSEARHGRSPRWSSLAPWPWPDSARHSARWWRRGAPDSSRPCSTR